MKSAKLSALEARLDTYETILGFCVHGRVLGMVIDMPGAKRDVREFMANRFYRRFERVRSEDGRKRFDGTCEQCTAERQQAKSAQMPLEIA